MSESGNADQLKGRIKEAAGAALDRDDLREEGKIDQASGEAKNKAEELIDKAKNLVTGKDDE